MTTLYIPGLKYKGKDDLRTMFGSDKFYAEPWLKSITRRIMLEPFLRQIHFEDSTDPLYKKYAYPEDGVWSTRCCLFIPERDLSYDDSTVKYV
mgnify:CR=1 FL=1